MTTTPTQTCLAKLATHAAHELEAHATNKPILNVFTRNLGELLIEAGSIPGDRETSEKNRHVLAAVRIGLKDAGNATRGEIRAASIQWGQRLLGSTDVNSKTSADSYQEMKLFALNLSAASQALAAPARKPAASSYAAV